MARNPSRSGGSAAAGGATPGISGVDALLLEAMERGDESLQTGRYIITMKPEAVEEGLSQLQSMDLRTADARDFSDQAVSIEDVGDADALVLPEIGVAIVTGDAFQTRGLGIQDEPPTDSAIETIEPEYFVFADGLSADYLRGFLSAAEAIAADFEEGAGRGEADAEVDAQSFGVTWGLFVTKAAISTRTGAGIRVAVLDTGMALNHPDFAGRTFVTSTFVGQPVQDLNSHGTHCIGTACGPKSPPGFTPRYGIAYQAPIYVGKVLTNAGGGTTGTVLAGMNWAVANKCAVISMSLGAQTGVQAAYTAAGQAALNNNLLMIAAAGNSYGQPTGAPANSPTIMSVASLDQNLAPSNFSNKGKIQIAAPGRDIFSSVPMPTRYGKKSGTSMATPHVAGCAALWAQTSAALRGQALWNKLIVTALPLPYPPNQVGAGLVQAP